MASLLQIAIRVRDETRFGLQVAIRANQIASRRISRIWRDAGRQAGQSFVQALNGNFGAALQGILKNPIVATVALAIVAIMSGIIGAGLAGAIILALGGAIAGLGIFLAAQSEEVKKKWGDTLKSLKKDFQEAAKPMLPVIEHARLRLIALAQDFVPFFERALTEMQGPLKGFIDSLEEGFRQFGGAAGDDIVKGFNAFLLAFGPVWEDFMKSLGESVGALARTVGDHSVEIGAAFRLILGVITLIIDTINFLANVWVFAFDQGIKGAEFMIRSFQLLVDAAFTAFAGILTAADAGLSWIPGIGDKITTARQDFDRFRDGVTSDLDHAADAVRGMGDTIREQSERNKLTADITQLEAKVAQAKKRLQETNDKKVQARIKGDISQLNEQLRQARGKLDALNGKTVHTWVINHLVARTEGAHGSQLGGKRSGGIIGAATGGIRSNLTMVGENGPEVVNLPPGSRVRSTESSRRMMQGAGKAQGEDGAMIFNFVVDGRVVATATLDAQRKVIAARGGNVQKVLGRGRA